jgi:hypothetical protein
VSIFIRKERTTTPIDTISVVWKAMLRLFASYGSSWPMAVATILAWSASTPEVME